jgi:hypothetical protein
MFMRIVLATLFLSIAIFCKAQQSFRTLVPQHPVVAGESFQVQYVIPESGKVGNFKTPSFKSFRFVSGPNQYKGSINSIDGAVPVTNYVFTLEATRPGRFIIPGAVATVNEKPVQSDDVFVEVISKQESKKQMERDGAVSTDYFLRPGENPYEKIRQNLFLKLVVDRTTCYAGEPVLATFKLYSRLESKSDIIKNPGFYGFTVHDMVNLADKMMTTENINGKIFDVHTIRKVQLYPLQEGRFTIDAMEVQNRVEFSRSLVNKKTEQQIVEGVLGKNDDDAATEDKEIVETSMSTGPVTINVKPVPLKNKPDGFSTAVGDFGISTLLHKDSIAKNEEGIFEIAISGNGNFTQLNAPIVHWPAGMEAFEPVIKDELDKTKFPLTGRRIFRYTFVSAKPGVYQLPTVSFSFFNPDSNKYKTISTTGKQLAVSNQERVYSATGEKKISIAEKNARASRIAAGIIISLALLILVYWIRQKKEPPPVAEEIKIVKPSIDEVLAPANSMIHAGEKDFYNSLHQCIWDFFVIHFQLSGSDMKKETVADKLGNNVVSREAVTKIQDILGQCENGMYTGVSFDTDKNKLMGETKEALTAINLSYSEYLYPTPLTE